MPVSFPLLPLHTLLPLHDAANQTLVRIGLYKPLSLRWKNTYLDGFVEEHQLGDPHIDKLKEKLKSHGFNISFALIALFVLTPTNLGLLALTIVTLHFFFLV